MTGACRVRAVVVFFVVFVGVALSPVFAARAATTGSTGGGQPINNVQPATTVGYIVATQGVFPSMSGPAVQGTILGEVRRFAGNFAPFGWAYADGQLLSIAQNTALFSLMGTTYGGDGVTTFALPDLRGRTPIHAGQGPGLANHPLGEPGGSETITLNLNTLPAHTHTTASGNTGSAGGNQSFDNRMPSLALTFIIDVSAGGFPPTSGTTPDTFFGEVRMFVGNFAPAGWAKTDGQLLQISSNVSLFSLLGTTYGGDGATTFALPDLRGRAPLQAGTGLSTHFIGEVAGQEVVFLAPAQLSAHTHTLPIGGSTGATGGGQAHTNLQPTLALTDIIAVAGIFPSRDSGVSGTFLVEVRWFAGTFAPGGWLSTDGQLLAIAQNQAVFSLLGTNFGGDGTMTFALPDLRGRVALHQGQGPGLTQRFLGAMVGSESEFVSVAQMAPHTHTVASPVPALPGWGVASLLVALAMIGARRARAC